MALDSHTDERIIFSAMYLLNFWWDPSQLDSQLIWKYHNFYNQFLDKVYINVKFIYQMFTRWRFRLATEFVMWMLSGQWTFDRKAAKENRWFPCVGICPNITYISKRKKPFLIWGGNMLSWSINWNNRQKNWSTTNLQNAEF